MLKIRSAPCLNFSTSPMGIPPSILFYLMQSLWLLLKRSKRILMKVAFGTQSPSFRSLKLDNALIVKSLSWVIDFFLSIIELLSKEWRSVLLEKLWNFMLKMKAYYFKFLSVVYFYATFYFIASGDSLRSLLKRSKRISMKFDSVFDTFLIFLFLGVNAHQNWCYNFWEFCKLFHLWAL